MLDTVEMLAFNLKLLSKKSRKRVLISAGKLSDKERMLGAIRKLPQMNIDIFATAGTSAFLTKSGIDNQILHKITDGSEPNIKSFLSQDRLDLVINVLTGNNDYDESSDSNLIRTLAIQQGIPLITDVDIAILTIDQLENKHSLDLWQSRLGPKEPWNLKAEFLRMVGEMGGFANYHGHFDKAYLISLEYLELGHRDMEEKWKLYKYLKENYTHDDLVQRIARCVEAMINQGVTYCRTLVDADSTVKLATIHAALEVKNRYRDQIVLEIGTQPLQGVVSDKASLGHFAEACALADVVGGLPSRDRPRPEKHLDTIMGIAKSLGKPLDVHVDQENNPDECETELLALKTIEHGLEGRVCAVHAISLAAKPKHEQQRVIKIMKDAGLKVIICPSAALSMKALERTAPLHNSIAPLGALLEAEIPIYLGVDNVCDLFMPVVDGDMWFECRLLMEAARFYDIERVARLACDKSGFAGVRTADARS
jgi:cytosine/adenosine deaminase-related metal-dependent hydrolase